METVHLVWSCRAFAGDGLGEADRLVSLNPCCDRDLRVRGYDPVAASSFFAADWDSVNREISLTVPGESDCWRNFIVSEVGRAYYLWRLLGAISDALAPRCARLYAASDDPIAGDLLIAAAEAFGARGIPFEALA